MPPEFLEHLRDTGLALSFYEVLALATILFFYSIDLIFLENGTFLITHGLKWFVSVGCVRIRHLSDRCLQKCTCVIAPVCVYGRVNMCGGQIKVIQPDHVICKSFSDLLLSAHGGHQDHRA